jgi:hypothetical protein
MALVLSILARCRLIALAGAGLFLAAGAVLICFAFDETDDELARAEAAPARAERILQEAKAAEVRADMALGKVKQESAELEQRGEQLDKKQKDLKAEAAKVAEDVAGMKALAKEVETAKKEAAAQRMQAKAERVKAEETLDQADQKEMSVKSQLKKVQQLIDGTKAKLKSNTPAERRGAVHAMFRLGNLAASADRDLCEMAAFDPEPLLRRDALDALEKANPRLYPLAVTLTLPPEDSSLNGYTRAISQLPEFGSAGLPLIRSHLEGSQSPLAKNKGIRSPGLLPAHLQALAKIAERDDVAFQMLLTLPRKTVAIPQHSMANDVLRVQVGKHLLELAMDYPQRRKEIVPYFTYLLEPESWRENPTYVAAANALSSLAPESQSALPILRRMRFDRSEQVRNAVRAAIAAIEK